MNFIKHLLISALAIIITAYILPGIHLANVMTAIILAAVLSFLNAIVKPLLVLLTIPITVVTLGLFLLVINAGIIMLADYLITGFAVDGFIWALIFSLILSFVTSLLSSATNE